MIISVVHWRIVHFVLDTSLEPAFLRPRCFLAFPWIYSTWQFLNWGSSWKKQLLSGRIWDRILSIAVLLHGDHDSGSWGIKNKNPGSPYGISVQNILHTKTKLKTFKLYVYSFFKKGLLSHTWKAEFLSKLNQRDTCWESWGLLKLFSLKEGGGV